MANYIIDKDCKRFLNPYTFIPLEDQCTRGINHKDIKKQELSTGYIECKLESLSPIFIPNTLNDNFFEDPKTKSYDFFSYKDNTKDNEVTNEPVIPGSSIRGCIRSAFETLTNSCMSTVSDEHILYKRVTSPGTPGIIRKIDHKWIIYKCKRYGVSFRSGNTQDHSDFSNDLEDFKNGDKIYFTVGGTYKTKRNFSAFEFVNSISKEPFNNSLKGIYHQGESFGNKKHHESIFVETNDEVSVNTQALENLLANYILYQDDTVNLHKKQKKGHYGYISNIENAKFAKIDDLDGMPIYYKQVGNKLYLSPAAIGREVYHNKLNNIIKTYSACRSSINLCQACALFGFISNEKENNAVASRISFSDAKILNAPKFLNPLALPELSSPKISSMEMYLKRPKNAEKLWNYDYIDDSNKGAYTPEIKGRKFYWHHSAIGNFSQTADSDRQVVARPLDKGAEFTFKIYFNNITSDELDKLRWVLTLGKNEDLAHKIGMGKPVGLGSVKISIQNTIIRKISIKDNEFSYILEEDNRDFKNINLGCSETTKLAFTKLSNYKNCANNIVYPYCIDDNNKKITMNYEWFVGNKLIKGKGTDHIIEQVLPDILSKVELQYFPYLKEIKKTDKKPDNYQRSNYGNNQQNYHRRNNKDSQNTTIMEQLAPKQLKNIFNSNNSKTKNDSKSLTDLNVKNLTKELNKMKSQKYSKEEIERFESQLKKRSDYKQKDLNSKVKDYLKLFEEIKNNNL